jgi:hypothetical protein
MKMLVKISIHIVEQIHHEKAEKQGKQNNTKNKILTKPQKCLPFSKIYIDVT